MNHHPDNHRSTKSVFSLSGFRGRLVALIVIAGFLCVSLFAVMFYAYVVDSYDVILRHSTLPEDIIAERYGELYGIAMVLGGIGLAVVAVVAIWTLYITQRVAGPVYHLQKVIDSIKAGHPQERLHLRAKDEFQELARSFNELMDQMQQPK